MGTIDAKVTASALGIAVSSVVWTLLTWFNSTIAEKASESPETFAGVVGASALVFGFIFGYRVPNAASPLPGDGAGTAPEDA